MASRCNSTSSLCPKAEILFLRGIGNEEGRNGTATHAVPEAKGIEYPLLLSDAFQIVLQRHMQSTVPVLGIVLGLRD